MIDSSIFHRFFIDFNAVYIFSKDNIGIDQSEYLSSSFGTSGLETDNNDQRKVPKSSLSIGHAIDWIGALRIFCKCFVFSNLLNRNWAHFDFHSRSSFSLAYESACLGLVDHDYHLHPSFAKWNLSRLLIPLNLLIRSYHGAGFLHVVLPWLRSPIIIVRMQEGSRSSISSQWEWYSWGWRASSRIGFHPLNERLRIFHRTNIFDWSGDATMVWPQI